MWPSYKKTERLYIVCTGPSLKDFDFDLLKYENVFAVNYAYKYVPCMDALIALDRLFYEREYEYLSKVKNVSYTVSNYHQNNKIPDQIGDLKIIKLKSSGTMGLSYNKTVRHGCNSGYLALSIAVQTGCRDIRLLGFDLNYPDKIKHFYENKEASTGVDLYYVVNNLLFLKKDLDPSIKITNYSINSRETVFEKKDLSLAFE